MAWPSSITDGELLTAARLNQWFNGITNWLGNVDTAGYALIFSNAAPTDGNIPNRGIVIWIDQVNHLLKFRVRYSDGTLKSGQISLT